VEAATVGAEMITIFSYLTLALILCYIPFVCVSDIRTRTFNPLYLSPLAVVGLFSTAIYLLDNLAERNIYLLGLTGVLCIVVLALAIAGVIGGADFIFASMIMIFMQYNPLVFPRVFFALDFFWTFMLFQVALAAGILAYNFVKNNPGNKEGFTKAMWHMANTWPGKFSHAPNLVVISAAFITTLIMEVYL
jgi:hypothetical protein